MRQGLWGYSSTIVRILQEGGGASWTGRLVAASVVLQRRVWLGLRRCPTGPPSNVFRNRGTPPVPPAGAAPLHPAWGRHGGSVFSPSAGRQGRGQDASAGRMVLLRPVSSFSGGSGLACAVVPPARPPTFLETGGLPLLPPAGAQPPAPCLERRKGRSFHLAYRSTFWGFMYEISEGHSGSGTWNMASRAAVERQQLAENVVVRDVRRPTVRGSHSSIKGFVCVGEPLRPSVVEVR